KIEREAVYTFIVTSDDGSRLYIDGKLVVDNDGIHAPQARQGSTRLTKGVHKITVGFMQGGGGAELDVQIEAPGFGHHHLRSLVAVSEAAGERTRPVTRAEDSLEVRPALGERGGSLFASWVCASGTKMTEGRGAIASTGSPPPLNKLKGDGGCLAATATKGLPA